MRAGPAGHPGRRPDPRHHGPAQQAHRAAAMLIHASVVNGQVAVPAGGQLKVPTPRVDQGRFVAVAPFVRASRMR